MLVPKLYSLIGPEDITQTKPGFYFYMVFIIITVDLSKQWILFFRFIKGSPVIRSQWYAVRSFVIYWTSSPLY